ncbi:MAG: hypothetical protein CMO19_02540 [Thaumarchaeota archaeon]|nr:hypothetical protein [Nitrososphaerota archaeon]|tara:strand:+ start:5956 stop:6843 length:888 start_codon:yes stop_codon:yes gene_type:complete
MIGASTSYYGYHGESIENKVKKLIDIFVKCEMKPYIQIGAGKNNIEYNELVNILNDYRDKNEVIYTIHQSIWLPSDDFYINIASSDEQIREKSINCIEKNIEFARDIGVKNISFHGGYATNTLSQKQEFAPLDSQDSISYEEAYNNSIDSLNRLIEIANGDVKLSIENFNFRPERRYLFSRVEDFDRIPDKIGVIMNIGHLYYTKMRLKQEDYITKMIDVLTDKVNEIHINDNDGSEDLHKLVGKGDIPIREILKLIKEKRDLPHLIIEAHKQRHSYSDDDLMNNILELREIARN